ncbi:MAG: septal ring lytic transglycosylase RlpA family protein [Candidatus Omnitrophica bacterium]|nr:septal ring lytic transglycosylase RlpA family protein [Candidatus Omnitrophota bacterium]
MNTNLSKIKVLSVFLFLVTLCFAGKIKFGLASWYGSGNPDEGLNVFTADGNVFNPHSLTCATRHYPFGTKLKVINIANKKTVIVEVNDRGPASFLPDRKIDLSKEAFSHLANPNTGIIPVIIEQVKNKSAQQKTYRILKQCREIVKQEITKALNESLSYKIYTNHNKEMEK